MIKNETKLMTVKGLCEMAVSNSGKLAQLKDEQQFMFNNVKTCISLMEKFTTRLIEVEDYVGMPVKTDAPKPKPVDNINNLRLVKSEDKDIIILDKIE